MEVQRDSRGGILRGGEKRTSYPCFHNRGKTVNTTLPLHNRSIYLISVLLVLAIGISLFTFSPAFYLKSLAIDDAMYYPVVARNIATGNGSTFDNITQTNGYHPLWCWLNIPFSLLSDDSMTRLFIFKGLLVVIVLTMLFVWDRLLNKLAFSMLFRSYFLLFMGASYWWSIKVFYSGMETALACLLIGLDFHLLLAVKERQSRTTSICLGLLLGLTFLSRLDTVFFLVAVFATIMFLERRLSATLCRVIAACSILTLPYLFLNWRKFGSIIPLSGLKKARVGNPAANVRNVLGFLKNEAARGISFVGAYPVVLSVCFVLLVVSVVAFKRSAKVVSESGSLCVWGQYRLFVPLFAATILHFLYNLLLMSEIHVSWYQYFIYLTMFLVLSGALTYMQVRSRMGILYFAVWVVGVVGMVVYGWSKYPRPAAVATVEVAEYVKAHVRGDHVFMMIDPGIFRYVSGQKTLAGNGLIGDRRLMELSCSGNEAAIIREYGVDYLVGIFRVCEIAGRGNPIYTSKGFTYSGERSVVAMFDTRDFKELRK